MIDELRIALRRLMKSPGFALTVVLTLAMVRLTTWANLAGFIRISAIRARLQNAEKLALRLI